MNKKLVYTWIYIKNGKLSETEISTYDVISEENGIIRGERFDETEQETEAVELKKSVCTLKGSVYSATIAFFYDEKTDSWTTREDVNLNWEYPYDQNTHASSDWYFHVRYNNSNTDTVRIQKGHCIEETVYEIEQKCYENGLSCIVTHTGADGTGAIVAIIGDSNLDIHFCNRPLNDQLFDHMGAKDSFDVTLTVGYGRKIAEMPVYECDTFHEICTTAAQTCELANQRPGPLERVHIFLAKHERERFTIDRDNGDDFLIGFFYIPSEWIA